MRLDGVVRRIRACKGAVLAAGVWLVMTGVAGAAVGAAQSTHIELPTFEVVSIKPYKAGEMMIGIRMSQDGVTTNGMPLYMIVREAFGVSDNQILNEPGWVKSARYNIAAKVDAVDVPKLKKLDVRQRWAMFLPVLEDRFGLKFHHETKREEVYTLVIAKGGPKLHAVKRNESGAHEQDPKRKGRMMMRMSTKGRTVEGHETNIESLVRLLSMQLGSPVVDKTGLTGTYDFTLGWTPVMGPKEIPGGPPEVAAPGGDAAPVQSSGPSLFTALQEQLGLKLVARKEPVDVIVIDHIEQPSPN